jgi:hypothetical protein
VPCGIYSVLYCAVLYSLVCITLKCFSLTLVMAVQFVERYIIAIISKCRRKRGRDVVTV